MLIKEKNQIDYRSRFEELKNSSRILDYELLFEVEQIAEKAQKSQQLELLCDILIYLGRAYRLTNQAFNSIKSLNKAYITLNSNFPHQKERLAKIYRELGNTYSNSLNDHLTSIEYQTKGFNLNVKSLNGIFLNNIGSNHLNLGEFEKAIQFFKKGISYCSQINDLLSLAYLNVNYARAHIQNKNPNDAFEYLKKSIIYCKDFNSKTSNNVDLLSSYWINSWAYLQMARAHLDLNQQDEAKLYLKIGKEFTQDKKQDDILAKIDLLDGELLLSENKMAEYETLYKSSIKFCETTDQHRSKHEWLTKMQDIQEKNKDYEKAFFISKEINKNLDIIKAKHQEFNVSQILVSKEEEILALENKNRIMQLQKDELKQFAYIVTHDLKTPLSNISNFAGLFKKRYEASIDDKGRGYLDYVIKSANNLTSMLSALMQYISFENSDDETFEPCSINTLIPKILEDNQISKEQYKLNFNGIETVPIRTFHLDIILENLLKNSKKFKKESEPLFVEINIEQNMSEYIFSIGDNGIGIDDKYKVQIFEIFKRLNKNQSAGTGIGLSICKKIIQGYMGNLWVEDNVNSGSLFKFTIPSKIKRNH